MFTTYIKNLNDMVFSTSDSPEQQPSTGVLGRIGSWLSPWKGNAPKSPTENASSTGDRPLNSDGGDESEESVKRRVGDPHRGEVKGQSSSPGPLDLARDIFPCEEQDATQSSHKHSSVVSSTETEPGGPKEEEFVACAKKRTGQDQEWEESSNGPSVSGNPKKNASHLTHLSSLSKQGVAQDSDQAHAQAQAQTGRRLHVYLEETCVTHCGQDTCAGQEVVRTKVTKNLKALTKANSFPGFHLKTSSSSTCAENKRTNVSHAGGEQSYYSALTGVSLKSQKGSQLDPDADTEETEGDSMGRRNSSKRRHRKGSQGDGGNSPREKTPPNAQRGAEGFPSVASPQGKSPEALMGNSPLNSASQSEPASPASPEGVESESSCPDAFEQLDKFQDKVTAETVARVVHGGADMEDDDRFYKVERKTETPESKRRSMKVSRTEVKLFTKNVPLNSKKSPGDRKQDSTAGGNTNNEGKDEGKAETDARLPTLKKVDEELKPKPVAGRIADKISLFERKQAAGGHKPIIQSPRSADVSPARKDTEAMNVQRSRSAEGHSTAGSGSTSPVRDKPVTVKEQSENFTESSSDQSQKAAMTGMSEEPSPPPVTASVPESTKLDRQGELDTTELKTAVSEFTVKPDGRDTTTSKAPVPKEPPPIPDAVASKTATGVKCNSAESEVSDKGMSDSSEMTNNICPESTGPSKTSSRPKRRKSKDPVSPVSPNTEAKPTSKLEVTASKQTQAADTDKTASAPKPLTAKVSSDKAQGNASDKQQLSDSREKPLEQPEVLGKVEKQIESSLQMESTDKAVKRQEESPASADEPDTAAGDGGAKSDDKDPVVLPQREEKAGGHSLILTQERKVASADSRKLPASSPAPVAERPIEKTQQQESSVEHPTLDKEEPTQPELMQPSEKQPEQTAPQNKGTEIINHAESKDVEKLKAAENENTNHTETKDKDQPPRSNTTKDSDSGPNISGTEGSVDKNDEGKSSETKDKTRLIRDGTKPEARQPEAASQSPESASGSSDLCARTHVRQTESTRPGKAAVCAVTPTNEAVSGTECDKGPLKGESQRNVPPRLQTTSTQGPGREKKPVVSATEPQPNSVSLEKTENSPDDSHTQGARDEFSSSKLITKAATALEEVTVKATNGTPALITAHAGHTGEDELSFKEPNPISVCKSAGSEGAQRDDGEKRSTIKPVASGVKIPRDINERAAGDPQAEVLKSAVSKRDTTSPKCVEKLAQSPSDSRAAEKTLVNELVPVANGDNSLQPLTAKKEPLTNKPCHAPKAPPSPEANKPTPDSTQHSPVKKLHSPRGQSRDDSSKWQDTPSSWLDVDLPKRKLKVAEPKLSSSGSEGNILDTSGELDDDDFVEKIKKLCSPFSLPPRKHNHLRPPQPPFAMPAIKEDRFEKTFDPEEFTFGLRKKKEFTLETGPSLLAQLSTETKSSLKPARASLADRSMLLSGLREKNPDEEIKEEKDDQKKVKSRLEGSCILSSLTSSSIRGKRNGLQTQVDGTTSGGADGKMSTPVSGAEVDPNAKPVLPGCAPASDLPVPDSKQPAAQPQGLTSSSIRGKSNGLQTQVDGSISGGGSPSEGGLLSSPSLSQSPLPSPTPTAPITDELAKQSPAPGPKEEAQAAEAVVCDSGPPFPRFNDIKLPDYLEKYLLREQVKPVQSLQGQEPVKQEVDGKMSTPVSGAEADPNAKPALSGCAPAPNLPGPELKQPASRPQGLRSQGIRPVRSFHKRPGKMVLFEKAPFGGQAHEIHRDAADATSLQLSPLISVKVVRGCWILYEKPDFQGRSIALEEGITELTNEWAEPEVETEPHDLPPVVIGSIRLAVRDYSVPRIDLFTEPEGHGRVTPYQDDAVETGSFGIPLSTASIQVHSGVWLVFSDPEFQGMLAILEPGEYPFPESWGFPSPFVGSLRPLKMGCFKVEHPNEVKAVVYENAHFEGSCLETDSDVFSLCEDEGCIAADGALPASKTIKTVGSLKITGGLWVGYSQPGFEGQQYVLEEGEYVDCSDWGGSEQILSLRPILADFVAPHLKMFTDKDFPQLGGNIDLTGAVVNMDDTGYGLKTQSVEVIGGVWVVFEEPGFCGESYILEKGLYGSPEDWGARRARVASVMPVLLDDFENAVKFKVQLFSDPGFQGSVLPLEDSVASLQDGFSFASCKVVAGSWVAFEGQDFSGRMYVLEAGDYPDLRAMGCDDASSSIRSLQTVGFEFSLPSITLFERCDLRGKRVVLTDGSVNLQLAGGCGRVQSVLVEGAIWILYERINFQGAQVLLRPGEVLDWREFSGWQKIGSLRPLIQKQVHFRLRNRLTGLMMSVDGTLEDVKLMRIQEAEESGGLEQIWFYQNGHLYCKLLEECCLSPSGSVTIAGSRTGLSPEPGMHLWSITPEGFIRYSPTSDLVLEVKGGHKYDKTQVILNSLDPNKLQQRWDVEVM